MLILEPLGISEDLLLVHGVPLSHLLEFEFLREIFLSEIVRVWLLFARGKHIVVLQVFLLALIVFS